jgi:hypothetical protein
MLLFDAVAVISSTFAAFSIRLGYLYYPTGDGMLLLIMPIVSGTLLNNVKY